MKKTTVYLILVALLIGTCFYSVRMASDHALVEERVIIWPVLIYAAGAASSILLQYIVRYVRAYRKEAKRKKGENDQQEKVT